MVSFFLDFAKQFIRMILVVYKGVAYVHVVFFWILPSNLFAWYMYLSCLIRGLSVVFVVSFCLDFAKQFIRKILVVYKGVA